MAKPPTPTLPELLFEKCTVITCARSQRSPICPACADCKDRGKPLCRNCLASLTPALAVELQASEIRLGYENLLYRALLELKARDFYEGGSELEGALPKWPRPEAKE